MTSNEIVYLVSLGGFAALIALILIGSALLGLVRIVAHFLAQHYAYRERRAQERQQQDDLATCRAIDALPTVPHPLEPS